MSFAWHFWIFATCLLSTALFAAPQVTSADRTAIVQCVSAPHDIRDYGETSCVGIIPNPCVKVPSSRDPQIKDAKACAARELALWDERLQASLKIVNASFPALQPAITDAQSNWLKSREELCSAFYIEESNDRTDLCRLQETSRRALIIECMSLAHDNNGSAETCIGSLAGHCELAPGENARACAVRALSISKKRLQAAVNDVGGKEEAQSYWLKSREKLCPLFGIIDPGMDRVGSDRCRQLETSGRAEVIERLVEIYSG